MSHDARLDDLVIKQGNYASNAVDNPVSVQNIVDLLVYGSTKLIGRTTFQVSPVHKNRNDATDWYDFQWIPGTDVTILPGKAVRISARCIKAVRLSSDTQQVEDVACPLVVQQDT